MSLVVDASMALAWHFPDEQTDQTAAALWQVVREGAVVPVHWRAEIANGMAAGVRRGRMKASYRDEALQKLESLDITIDVESDIQLWRATQRLSERHSLTAYAAAYLELAQRLRLPLATLDRALAQAARIDGVFLYNPTDGET